MAGGPSSNGGVAPAGGENPLPRPNYHPLGPLGVGRFVPAWHRRGKIRPGDRPADRAVLPAPAPRLMVISATLHLPISRPAEAAAGETPAAMARQLRELAYHPERFLPASVGENPVVAALVAAKERWIHTPATPERRTPAGNPSARSTRRCNRGWPIAAEQLTGIAGALRRSIPGGKNPGMAGVRILSLPGGGVAQLFLTAYFPKTAKHGLISKAADAGTLPDQAQRKRFLRVGDGSVAAGRKDSRK